jgi:putative ABC transport system permease protein
MLHQIKYLLRSAGKNKATMSINILGLSVGLAATILLVVYILHEWSYDRHFSKADNIHRLHSIWIDEGKNSVEPINLRQAFTEITQNVPGIETAVQIYRGGSAELKLNESRFTGNNLLYVDSTFFRVFSFKFLEGNPEQALDNPQSVVLTKSLAQKIFGTNSAIGQVVVMNNQSYQVAAVTEDVPVNTHFSYDLLIPMKGLNYLHQLGGLEFFTYYLFNQQADSEATSLAVNEANTQLLKKRFNSFNYNFSSEVEPLKRLHLFSKASYDLGPQGSVHTVILVGIIALLVMLLAITNFVNLFIVAGEQRSKEIGVRKVNGAGKRHIIQQFFAETSMVVVISFIIGMSLALLLLPEFGNIMQRRFSFGLLQAPVFIISLITVLILTVLFAGSYPSFYLSRFNPASILKPQAGRKGRKKTVMNLMGGLQLVITLFLLTYLFGINHQVSYLKNISPGFNPEGLVNIYNLNDGLKQSYPSIRNQLLNLPEVSGVAAASHTIGGGTSGQGIRLMESSPENVLSINEYRIQPGLCSLLELELKEGRFFDPERESDRKGVILNEAAAKMLGLSTATGRQVIMFSEPLEVIGVVKDFHYESAARIVQPLVLSAYSANMSTILVKLEPQADQAEAMKKVEGVLKSFDNGYVLNSRNTLDMYKRYYAGEERLVVLIRMGAALAVFIVMMGVFMLVSQSIARRTKEIGIRKVMGGSVAEMVRLIYSGSLVWIAIASLIAIPLSYFMLQRWLQDFAVKAPLEWWLFAQGIVLVLILQTIITFGQTWRAANKNPVESLRYE